MIEHEEYELDKLNELKEILIKGANQLNVELSQNQIEKFFRYMELLLQWNEKMNLTAITNEKDIIIKHFLDSLSVVDALNDVLNKEILNDSSKSYKIADIGTGAGFPGLPLKIAYPTIDITLIDSLNKRVKFLNEVINSLSLNNSLNNSKNLDKNNNNKNLDKNKKEKIEALHMRAEEGGKNTLFREKYDFCFSRAVANMTVLSEFCIPYVKMGGYFVAMKGSEINDELTEANIAINRLGGEISSIKTVLLPFSDIKHTIIKVKKVRQTNIKYPRTYAQISKNAIK